MTKPANENAERTSGEPNSDEPQLVELLNETKILLPGTEVFAAFLATVPFTAEFAHLDGPRRVVYLATFFSTLLALVLFVVPAAYHRIARPIADKERFKCFANRFLVAGLVPMSLSMILATYLVTYMVFPGLAVVLASVLAALIGVVWWVFPLVRAHDRMPAPLTARGRSGISQEIPCSPTPSRLSSMS